MQAKPAAQSAGGALASILQGIGNTPLVPLRRMNPFPGVAIYAKLESFNPGGSIKDRIALNMIESAEASGELTPERTVLEATSGNTGIGLAMVCAVKGYKCCLIMPESASIERRKIMEAFGAEIVLTPGKRGTDGAIEHAYALARQHPDRYFLTDQFNNDANWQTHYKTTGPEIWEQTGGLVTDVVATLGTSGTAMGLCRYFSEFHPGVKVTAMEPFLGHRLQGLKNMKESYTPGIFDKRLPYQICNIPDEEALDTVRLLASQEGLLVGMSSGAAMCAALRRAAEMKEGVLVVIFPDGGEKYLSTELFSRPQAEARPEPEFRLFNTMGRRKEIFRPLRPDRVTFYACGPTAYEPANLAHCRRFVFADLLHRVLSWKGYQVKFYMNFTDLDDNTIRGAQERKEELAVFTGRYIGDFIRDMDTLGVLEASGYPRASDHVAAMIEMAHRLMGKGYAYEKHGSIYFDISNFPGYGKLSGVDLDKIMVGKTVDLDDYDKESPVDFTLLKRSTLSELKSGIFYQTDWGNMRPGWHIECAAMTLHYLGDTMDIHTSSRDLLFPHHENENAIAEALTGKPLANFWLHSELLLMGGRKMSVDNNNVITLRDLLARGYSGREVRYFLLHSHYRKPIHFSWSSLEAARKNLKRLDAFVGKLLCLPPGPPHAEVAACLAEMEDRVGAALHDDINVSSALAALFAFVKRIDPILAQGRLGQEQQGEILAALRRINAVFNIMELAEEPLAPEIAELIRKREDARDRKDWQEADRVREELALKGVDLVDTKKGTVWKMTGRPGSNRTPDAVTP